MCYVFYFISRNTFTVFLIISALVLLCIWIAWSLQSLFLPVIFSNPPTLSDRGQWGDSFGALNALLSALAFVGVIATLWMQQRQIRDAQHDQHIQRFESSFFELIRLFREARDAVQFRYTEDYSILNNVTGKNNSLSSGLEAIRRANFEIIWRIRRNTSLNSAPDRIRDIYETSVFKRYESTTSPYFRLLYTILFRIKEDKVISAEEKRRYANLFRSQLSSHEVALAGFNGLSPVSKDLGLLIEEFRLLKYLPDEFGRSFLAGCYSSQAFADRPD
ncbi:putative phage abortive infection protein [Mesorhizobium sp. CA10]|uniref:putative phage abortive infection protein n=1 Tax=Mesorhizobium sp. CA10 TaxID=588495 RepID=UPI001CCCB738|nr:putative phage abortive infection protein [Mesorhizobium sp. CA10]MBZ9884079.1 putative phage abortive infection protein [Mesorhizobium sp. CA10]